MGKKSYDMGKKSYDLLPMIGGGKCTLCRSEGANKSTCPLNPAAHGGNPAKHPLAMAANNVEPHGREKNTISISEIVPKKSSVVLQQDSLSQTTALPKKSSVVLQQGSLSQTSASDQLKQLPVVESIIFNMYNMDDVNSFCSSTKEIQKTCKKLFNKGALEQEIKNEIKRIKYGDRLPATKKDTAIESHIKSLMRITNPEGLDLLKSLITTLGTQSIDKAERRPIYGEGPDKELSYYTNKELRVPLAFKKSIMVLMLKPDLEVAMLKNRMQMQYISGSTIDDISYGRVIDASNGMYVSVGDVLEAFFENNREIYKHAQEQMGKEYPFLGRHIFARLYEICPGVYDMRHILYT